MRFGHVLLTVFRPAPRKPGTRLDEDWWHERWQLFTAYTVPSVAAQSERDFTWLVICPPDSPAWFRALTGTVDTPVRMSFAFSRRDKALRPFPDGATDALLVTSLGSADALHRQAMERIRSDCEADPFTSATVTLTDGYLLDDAEQRMRTYHGFPARFRTRIDLGPDLDPLTADESRISVGHAFPARSISEGDPMFVLVSHESNDPSRTGEAGGGLWLDPAATADILDRDFGGTLADRGGRDHAGTGRARGRRARPVSQPGWLPPPSAPASSQRVVVSIPCFQAWDSMAGAVESILEQTHQDLLVVVANDGDDDPGWKVLSHIDDPRLVRFDYPVNRGRFFADQTVLMARLGRYLLIHDADERSEPDRVQSLLEELRRSHGVAAVSAHYEYGSAVPGTPAVVSAPLTNSRVTPLYLDSLAERAFLAYRALFDIPAVLNVGGCYGGYRLEYDNFLFHLIRMAGGVTGLDRPLYHWERHESEHFDPAARQSATDVFARLYEEAYHLYCEYLQGSVSFEVLSRQLRGLAWRHVSGSEWDTLRAESSRLRWQVKTARRQAERPEPRPARTRPPDQAGLGDRLFAAFTMPALTASFQPSMPGPTAALVVTGVLTAESQATLDPDAVAYPLLPHDAAFMLERTGADLVIIEASAMLPGNAWAYAAHPAAADRGRKLADLVDAAHTLGKPVVFLRNVPSHRIPGLGWLDAMCDAVVRGDLGVQLSRFNPIGLPGGRQADPLYIGAVGSRPEPGGRRLLSQLTGGDRPAVRVAEVPWRELPECYRRNGLFLAASASQAREQRACGARVVGPVESGGTRSAPLTLDAAAIVAQLDAARAAGTPAMSEVRQVLREIFQADATPVRLGQIARLAGLPVDACPTRRFSVLAEVRHAADVGPLAEQLLRQRLRPSEVVTFGAAAQPRGQAATGALAALADAGITVSGAAGETGPQAVQRARHPWIAPWNSRSEYSDWYLLDLMCARECSQADVIGRARDRDYVFVSQAKPGLIRRDLLLPGQLPSRSWSRRGTTILSVAP